MVLRSSPWLRLRKSGTQKRYSHQIGSVRNLPIAKAQVCRRGNTAAQGNGTIDSGGSLWMCDNSAADTPGCSSGRR